MRGLFVILSAIFLFYPQVIFAEEITGIRKGYFCWSPSDLRDISKNADVVFTGKIRKIEDYGIETEELGTPRIKATFSVEQSWKGVEPGTRILSVDTEGLYQYNLEEGESYLVYGYKIYDGRISIIGCPRTKKVEDAEREIGLLGFPSLAYIKEGADSNITVKF